MKTTQTEVEDTQNKKGGSNRPLLLGVFRISHPKECSNMYQNATIAPASFNPHWGAQVLTLGLLSTSDIKASLLRDQSGRVHAGILPPSKQMRVCGSPRGPRAVGS